MATDKRKKISKEKAIKDIVKLLRDGYSSEDIVSIFVKRCQIVDRTVYRYIAEAREIYNKQESKVQEAVLEVHIEERKKAQQNGLKSKYERDLEIQKQIDYYNNVLNGIEKPSFILGREIEKNEPLPLDLIMAVSNTLRGLYQELAKRLGEYEPKETLLSFKQPKLDKVSTEALEELRRAYDEDTDER